MFDKLWNSICDGARWFRARMENIESSVVKHIEDNLKPAVSSPARKVLAGSMLVLGTVFAFVMAPWLTVGAALAGSLWRGVKRACDSAEGPTLKSVAEDLLLVAVDTTIFSAVLLSVGYDYIFEGISDEQADLFVAA